MTQPITTFIDDIPRKRHILNYVIIIGESNNTREIRNTACWQGKRREKLKEHPYKKEKEDEENNVF
jgi:hypothetical protein